MKTVILNGIYPFFLFQKLRKEQLLIVMGEIVAFPSVVDDVEVCHTTTIYKKSKQFLRIYFVFAFMIRLCFLGEYYIGVDGSCTQLDINRKYGYFCGNNQRTNI